MFCAPSATGRSALLAAGVVVGLLGGCGGERPTSRGPGASDSELAARAGPAQKAPYREVLSAEDEAMRRAQILAPRDEPLTVGTIAPDFQGYPQGDRAVIVFFRGHW